MSDPTPDTRAARRRPTRAGARTFFGLFGDDLDRGTITLLLAAGLFAGVGVTGGWSGAAEAERALPVVAVNSVVVADPLEVTVKKAYTADAIPTLAPAKPGARFVLVTVTVTNTSIRPVDARTAAASFAIDAVGLRQFGKLVASDEARPGMVRAIDGSPLGGLQPGVTQNLALIWEQDADESVPTEVTVTVLGHTWRTSALDGSTQWFDPAAKTSVHLPVEPFPQV